MFLLNLQYNFVAQDYKKLKKASSIMLYPLDIQLSRFDQLQLDTRKVVKPFSRTVAQRATITASQLVQLLPKHKLYIDMTALPQ